jgi:CRP-like cAMP-binding protein
MKTYRVDFDQGEMLYAEGSPTEVIYLIDVGEVEIFRLRGQRAISVQILKRGQFCGETGVLEAKNHPMSARAHTNVSCLAISLEEFENELKQVSPLIRRVMVNLVYKLRNTTNRAYGAPNR